MLLEEQGYSMWRCEGKEEGKEMRARRSKGGREKGNRGMSNDDIMPRYYGPY